MKKNTLLILSLFVGLFAFTSAQEISFSYGSGEHFGKGCIVSIDVNVDAKGKPISASDIVMESSMKYVDFVPATAFPYFFPPVIRKNGLIHIVAFGVSNDQLVTGVGKIGTLYFQANETDPDGSVKLYFLGTGNTTDTNLSYGGVDYLQSVGQAHVLMDQAPCVHEVAPVLSGGFAGVNFEDSLKQTVEKINDHVRKPWYVEYSVLLVTSFVALILLILFVLYRKQTILSIKKFFGGKHIK